MKRNGADNGGVQSVDRALVILDLLARRGAMGVTEIGGELGVHKSAASRLLATLGARGLGLGLVEQSREWGTFRLGFGLVRLAGASAAQLDLTGVTQEVCRRLAAELDETVDVAVLDGADAVNVSQVDGPLRSRCWTGSTGGRRCTRPRAARCCWPGWTPWP